jgi:hypothetical protein
VFQLGGGYALFAKYMPKVVKFVTDTIPGAGLLLQIPWLSRVCFSFISIILTIIAFFFDEYFSLYLLFICLTQIATSEDGPLL